MDETLLRLLWRARRKHGVLFAELPADLQDDELLTRFVVEAKLAEFVTIEPPYRKWQPVRTDGPHSRSFMEFAKQRGCRLALTEAGIAKAAELARSARS